MVPVRSLRSPDAACGGAAEPGVMCCSEFREMKSKRFMHVDKLIDKYIRYAEEINACNDVLFNVEKGFLGKNLKNQIIEAKQKHKKYQAALAELEHYYIGELEIYSHNDMAHIALKNSNKDAVSRARIVLVSSFQRFENTLITIEDSLNFNKTINLARLSILMAIISIAVSFV